MLEMVYMQKISKYVNLLPILIRKDDDEQFSFEKIKLEAKNTLTNNNIEWFDL